MDDEYDCSPAYWLTQPEEAWPGHEYTRVYDDLVVEWGVWRENLNDVHGGEA